MPFVEIKPAPSSARAKDTRMGHVFGIQKPERMIATVTRREEESGSSPSKIMQNHIHLANFYLRRYDKRSNENEGCSCYFVFLSLN